MWGFLSITHTLKNLETHKNFHSGCFRGVWKESSPCKTAVGAHVRPSSYYATIEVKKREEHINKQTNKNKPNLLVCVWNICGNIPKTNAIGCLWGRKSGWETSLTWLALYTLLHFLKFEVWSLNHETLLLQNTTTENKQKIWATIASFKLACGLSRNNSERNLTNLGEC